MGKKKKILVVSSQNSVCTPPYINAFKKLGYEVDFFDYRNSLVYSNSFIRKSTKLIPKIKYRAWKSINQKLLSTAKRNKPDYLFVIKGENIIPETVDKINKYGITTINWYTDYIWNWDTIKKIASVYDYFYLPDHYVLKKLWRRGLKNCYYLPFAADINENSSAPFKNRKNEYDITFVGSHRLYPNRERHLSVLKDFDLNIWGPKDWLKSSLKEFYRGRAEGEEMMNIYQGSRIVVNIHYSHEPAEGTNLRPFEAMGAGAMLISDDVRVDLFRLFKENQEFISFSDRDSNELKKVVRYYLNHPFQRETIARRGFEKVSKKHTYLDRAKQIFQIIKD